MTWSIFAIAANAISPSGCAAYSFTLNGFLPYLRAPFYQFSEQNNDDVLTNGYQNPAFPFLTGHGGANQIVPFGFLGLRIDRPVMYINPSLPPQIPYLRLRDIYYGGAGLATTMNRTHTTIYRFSTAAIPSLADKYANTSMPIEVGVPGSAETLYNISVGQTLYVPNRMYFDNITYGGNMLQCKQVSSEEKYAPGQFPQGAIDGAISTVWQPASNESASLLVNITGSPHQRISEIYFNWAARPPRNVSVFLGNQTELRDGVRQLSGEVVEIPIDGVMPNDPYDLQVAAAAVVVPYVGNETLLELGNGVWSGDWVRLVIEGCWEDEDGEGATVAEFVLVGENGAAVMGNGTGTGTPGGGGVGNGTVVGTGVSPGNGTVMGNGTGT